MGTIDFIFILLYFSFFYSPFFLLIGPIWAYYQVGPIWCLLPDVIFPLFFLFSFFSFLYILFFFLSYIGPITRWDLFRANNQTGPIWYQAGFSPLFFSFLFSPFFFSFFFLHMRPMTRLGLFGAFFQAGPMGICPLCPEVRTALIKAKHYYYHLLFH